MLAPGVLFLLAFVAYPFFYGIFLSLQDRPVAKPGVFVGFANFVTLAHDPVFWQVARNMFIYTIVTTILKLGGGLVMALVMDQHFHGRNLVRAFLLLPFIVPTALSTIAWMWIFDPTFSVVNWVLVNGGVLSRGSSWLGNATLAMVSIIIVNTWRGMPFYGITLLAGLQTISPELYEVAAIDGATTRQRFWYVTMPLIKPVLVIVTMFSVIFTFSRLPAHLRLHPRRARQCDAGLRDVRVRPRHERRPARPGRGGGPVDAARARAPDRRAHPVPEERVGRWSAGEASACGRSALPAADVSS